MQHGGKSPPFRFLLQYSRHVLIRLTRMDHERQPGCARGGDMVAKSLFLRRPRAALVVVVEPGLSDGDHLGMAGAADQLIDSDVELLVRVMRMRANGAIDIGKALGDGNHLSVAFDSRRNGDDARDAGRPRAGNDGIELAGKIGKIEMAVAVDQCQSWRQMTVFYSIWRHVLGATGG